MRFRLHVMTVDTDGLQVLGVSGAARRQRHDVVDDRRVPRASLVPELAGPAVTLEDACPFLWWYATDSCTPGAAHDCLVLLWWWSAQVSTGPKKVRRPRGYPLRPPMAWRVPT